MISLKIRQIVALSKPRIIALLIFTTICGMVHTAAGFPGWLETITVVIGVSLSAAGSNAINQALDADIDGTMTRTRHRLVPSNQVSSQTAVLIGIVLIILAVLIMTTLPNLMAAALTLLASITYIFLYTILLKRYSWNNIVIGGAAGAFPPLIGSAAISSEITIMGLYMFVLIFFWTPPHFWTLSLLLKDEYSAAKVPMLSAVASHNEISLQIVLYSILLIILPWLPYAAGYSGPFFPIIATLLGIEWLRRSLNLRKNPSAPIYLSSYKYSLLYLAGVFLALAFDPLLPGYPIGL